MGNTNRITTKGQVTIPLEFREALGMLPGTDVKFVRDGDSLTVTKASGKSGRRSRGEENVALLRGSGNRKMSTDEILKLMRGGD